MLNLAFAGFRHSHIMGLYRLATESEKVNITGCFEENEKARAEAEEKGISFNYSSYQQLLEDENVQAVAIGDYYGTRGKLVIEALKHGKHVIADKPVCTSLSELDEIEKLASEKNLKIACMLDLRYMVQTDKVKELVESGEIGEIKNISFTGQHCLDYGARPSWYFEEGKHGGTINDIAIHGIDLLKFITGESLTEVEFAKTWNAFADKEPEFKDCGKFVVKMGEISVMADVSYAAPKCSETLPTYWDFYLWGTLGMINFRLSENDIKIYKQEKTVIECEPSEKGYLNQFIDEINGIETDMSTESVLSSQRQVLMIQKEADK